jgi:hypothetical protein
MPIVEQVIAYVQFELFEKNRQIANRRSFGRRLALNRFSVRGARRSIGLLHDVSQFMGQELAPGAGARRIHPGAEDNVMADGVCQRIDRPRGICRFRIRVHPHPTEVVTEARLEEGAASCVQRTSWG